MKKKTTSFMEIMVIICVVFSFIIVFYLMINDAYKHYQYIQNDVNNIPSKVIPPKQENVPSCNYIPIIKYGGNEIPSSLKQHPTLT